MRAATVLAADVEIFLEQESQHNAAYESFNRLLLERIYPDRRFLHRCAHGMIGGVERLSVKTGLGLSAAFEQTRFPPLDPQLATPIARNPVSNMMPQSCFVLHASRFA